MGPRREEKERKSFRSAASERLSSDSESLILNRIDRDQRAERNATFRRIKAERKQFFHATGADRGNSTAHEMRNPLKRVCVFASIPAKRCVH